MRTIYKLSISGGFKIHQSSSLGSIVERSIETLRKGQPVFIRINNLPGNVVTVKGLPPDVEIEFHINGFPVDADVHSVWVHDIRRLYSRHHSTPLT